MLKSVIAQEEVNNCQLEDQLRVLLDRMANIKAQVSKHEVTVRFLEPSNFEKIFMNAMAWKQFIDDLAGST